MEKRIVIYLFATVLTMFNFGCNKEEKMSISYPTYGAYGENILAIANNSSLTNGNDYSLSADLGQNAELKIIITNLSAASQSGPGAVWFYSAEVGWTVGDYLADTQQFESHNDGKIDLNILFENGPGSCRIDYYENSTSITNSKSLTW